MSEALRLYDQHGARLYALALRLTGSGEEAAGVLEEAFAAWDDAPGSGDPFGRLVRLTRERALAREARTAPPSVHPTEPVPLRLVDDVWLSGRSVATLASAHGMEETQLRMMLRDGMAELRRQFAKDGR
jgi:hypothetical protein